MYACNGSVGEKSLLSVLKYDEASGCFKGNFQYVADDDRINCYVVYANTSKVSVDTAARCITVDYQNQNGTLADAKARSERKPERSRLRETAPKADPAIEGGAEGADSAVPGSIEQSE